MFGIPVLKRIVGQCVDNTLTSVFSVSAQIKLGRLRTYTYTVQEPPLSKNLSCAVDLHIFSECTVLYPRPLFNSFSFWNQGFLAAWSLFFLSLIQESASCSTIDEVHYGLKWVHDLAGLPDPCNSSLVLPLIESAKRLLSIPVKKKEPVTPEAIQLLELKNYPTLYCLHNILQTTISIEQILFTFYLSTADSDASIKKIVKKKSPVQVQESLV